PVTVTVDNWEIVRSLAAVLAVLMSMVALRVSRSDKSADAQKAALARVENQLTGDVEALRHLIGNINIQMSAFEEAFKHIPTSRDFDLLQNSISDVSQAVARQQGALEANTRMVERMNSFLMERGT
ncbi:MAG: hypothetical protein ACT4QA_22155, partial [Panacagrimonas sp.]